MIYYKSRYNNESQLYSIIFKRLYDLREIMSTRRTFEGLNVVEQRLESRTSSQNYSLSIKKLNIKQQRIVKITTMRRMRTILTLRVRRSNLDLNHIQSSMNARTASLKQFLTLILVHVMTFGTRLRTTINITSTIRD